MTPIETNDQNFPEISICSVSHLDLNEMPEQIKTVWEANAASLTEEQKRPFFDLLMKHQTVFAKSKYDLGRSAIVQHEIFTGDHPPINQDPQSRNLLEILSYLHTVNLLKF